MYNRTNYSELFSAGTRRRERDRHGAIIIDDTLIPLKLPQFPFGQFEVCGFEASSYLLAPNFEPCKDGA
jgi:hypothetical protein